MELIVNIKDLYSLGITPDMYMYLYLKFHDLEDSFLYRSKEEMLDILQDKLLIKITDNGVILRQQALDLFKVEAKDKQFLEFWNTYPMKVPDGSGGYRILRSKSIETTLGKTVYKKYMKVISSPGEHNRVIKGLNIQLQVQRAKLQFLQNIETYINQRTWEKYCDLDDDLDTGNKTWV